MARRKVRRSHWSYAVDGPGTLRVFTSKQRATTFAKNLVKRTCGQTFVEKVKTNPAGVHNPYAKGAKVVWVGHGTRCK